MNPRVPLVPLQVSYDTRAGTVSDLPGMGSSVGGDGYKIDIACPSSTCLPQHLFYFIIVVISINIF